MPLGGVIEQFIHYRLELMAYVRALMRSPDDAADLFQDLFLAVRARDGAEGGDGGALADPARFLPWCRGVARNLALHRWRMARRRRELFAATPVSEARAAALAEWSASEGARLERDLLERCLEGLDPPSRRLLLLRFVAGSTSEDIARAMGESPAVVRARLMRVLDVVRGRIRSPGGGEGALR